jgi:hypothetical protein
MPSVAGQDKCAWVVPYQHSTIEIKAAPGLLNFDQPAYTPSIQANGSIGQN